MANAVAHGTQTKVTDPQAPLCRPTGYSSRKTNFAALKKYFA
jgi:hypothetical protein